MLIVGRKPSDADGAALGHPREEIIYFDRDLSWELQVKELIHCIRTGKPVADSSSEDALRVLELIEAVYRQARAPDVPARAGDGSRQ